MGKSLAEISVVGVSFHRELIYFFSFFCVYVLSRIIHFVNGFPLPPSLSSNAIDVVMSSPDASMFIDHMVNVSSIAENITTINPMTLLVPTNAAFREETYTEQQIDTLLQNHVFLDLVFMLLPLHYLFLMRVQVLM